LCPVEALLQSAQTPEKPHELSAEPRVQLPFLQQYPPLQVPFPAAPHADVQLPALQVGVAFVQAAHAPPPAPQRLFDVPAWHVLLVPLQQPALQPV
jgi:hypothetical protein